MRNVSTTSGNAAEFLTGGGEMGERIRSFDWSRHPLGPVEGWPQSLQIVIRIMLTSRYAMWLGWGPEFYFFCNDAYRPTLGLKEGWLGSPARQVWAEIWDDVGPRADSVMATGKATWDESLLLFLERSGYVEETYHTFSYSPVPDDCGAVGGLLCVVTEETERVTGERRMAVLRELAVDLATTNTEDELFDAVHRRLRTCDKDLPFALIYLFEANGKKARLACWQGADPGDAIAPLLITPESIDPVWPAQKMFSEADTLTITDLTRRFERLPTGPWDRPAREALIVPISQQGQEHSAGFLVAGINPYRPLDAAYGGFINLFAGQIAAGLANARAYAAERRRAEALAEIDRAKTTFFSNVSHEFRTPLTLMLGPLGDVLGHSNPDLTSEDRELLIVAQRNGKRLLKLVNTLLDFSRLEAGRARASYEPVDLAVYTAELASVFRSAIEKAGLRFVVDCPSLAEPVFVDRDMWEKIVLNLVSNAFKFTLEGEIRVSLQAQDDSVMLVVRDTGAGIPEAELPNLFNRFHRVEGARGRTYEGTGIGLALVQELAKLHGGTVGVESIYGEGSTFTVTLPLGKEHLPADQIGGAGAPAPTAFGAHSFVEEAMRWLPEEGNSFSSTEETVIYRPAPPPSFPDRRPLILLADDNADMRDYVSRLLADEYRIVAVADGQEALRAIAEQKPDLLLTDVMMPNLDGFGLLKILRADPETASIPVILLSARAGEEARVEGIEAGADDYLIKPFSARELTARIDGTLALVRARREAAVALREGEERLRLAAQAGKVGIWDWDIVANHVIWSDSLYAIHGVTTEEFDGTVEGFAALIHPQDRDYVAQGIQRSIEGDAPYELEFRAVRPDGEVVWLFTNAVVLRDGGLPRRLLGATVDITGRKRAEQALRDSEQRFARFMQYLPGLAWLKDMEGRYVFVNDAAERAFGRKRAELYGQTDDDIFQPETAHQFRLNDRKAVESGTGVETVEKLTQEDGVHHSIVSKFIVPSADGAPSLIGGMAIDITERIQMEEALRESEQMYRAIGESIDYGVWVCDPEGRNLYTSDSLLRLVGLTQEQCSNFGWGDVLHPDDAEATLAAWKECVRKGEQWDREHRFRGVDGRWHPILARGVPVRNERGEITAWAGINLDISRLKQIEDELREADQRKNEFLATLAHELRNPLAPIRNGLQIIRLAKDNRDAVERAQIVMERQLQQMVRLIDDLLDLSRVSRGKIELRRARVELAAVVRNAVETSRPLLEQSGHEFVLQLPAEPIFLDADATRLAQVFANLLNNAAKYTETGGRIVLQAEQLQDDIIVSVKDTGVGIPRHLLSRVFEMFTQVDRSLERSQGGLGIGLSIARRLVEMHGGTIEAKSDGQGMGSEFIVHLPAVASVDAEPHASQGDGEPDRGGARRRILVADDNADSAESMAYMLHIMGNEVRTAADGLEAIATAAEFRPDVILMDIGMPNLNGYEACQRIRGEDWGRKVAMIALTGWGQEEDKRMSYEAGFDHHLVKPIDPSALGKLLNEVPPKS